MDVVLAEAVARRIAAWMDSAAMFNRNSDFYRGIVVQIGEMFGKPAYTSDDGSVQQDVLALKVPELVQKLLSEHSNVVLPHPVSEEEPLLPHPRHDLHEETPSLSEPKELEEEKHELYPDVLTPEQRQRYEEAMAEISPALEKMCKELDDCTRLSAADFNITINAR